MTRYKVQFYMGPYCSPKKYFDTEQEMNEFLFEVNHSGTDELIDISRSDKDHLYVNMRNVYYISTDKIEDR